MSNSFASSSSASSVAGPVQVAGQSSLEASSSPSQGIYPGK